MRDECASGPNPAEGLATVAGQAAALYEAALHAGRDPTDDRLRAAVAERVLAVLGAALAEAGVLRGHAADALCHVAEDLAGGISHLTTEELLGLAGVPWAWRADDAVPF